MIQNEAIEELKRIFDDKDSTGIDLAAWIDKWFIKYDDGYEIVKHIGK